MRLFELVIVLLLAASALALLADRLRIPFPALLALGGAGLALLPGWRLAPRS
jgi:monovalent cation/hydrogen antiporter